MNGEWMMVIVFIAFLITSAMMARDFIRHYSEEDRKKS